jgi:hypothetical protein
MAVVKTLLLRYSSNYGRKMFNNTAPSNKKTLQGNYSQNSLKSSYDQSGNTNRGGRLSTVDLLIKVACFVKKENNTFNIKMS